MRAGLDVAVRAGAALAITGPNGAGKSTLGADPRGAAARGIAGTLIAAPELAGRCRRRADPLASRQLLTRIGTVFQEPEHQLLATTVRDELEVGPRALGLDAARPRRGSTSCSSGCGSRRSRARTRSRCRAGEKRRLTVAAALATAPPVLVLDEPTFGQDARTWAELVRCCVRIDAGSAVVAVTHDEDVLRHLGGHRIDLGGVGTASGGGTSTLPAGVRS